MAMRGLQVFISDIRAARSREEEEKRINKEKANILSKFKDGKLSSYDKKKYVCKLLYMHMLGWDVDFGHVEAMKLITGTTYTEKQIGYLAVTLLLSEQSELVRMVVNSIRQDLTSNNEVIVNLALSAVANVGGREMSEALHPDVYKLLVSSYPPSVRKRAALCLLRLYRKNPDVLPAVDWADRVLALLDDDNQGVACSVCSLVLALAQDYPNEYQGCVNRAVSRLSKFLTNDPNPNYEYYRVPNPWLQVKLLRLLQYYPPPTDTNVLSTLDRFLYTLISKSAAGPTDTSKGFNHSNALNSIIFEALNLAIHLDPDSEIMQKGTILLGAFISHKESNLRYLGLGTMANLALVVSSLDGVKKHTDTVLQALRDRDISVRRQALDLLYSMCDASNSRRIVAELLEYLGIADYAIREELVLKIAILAERFATEYSWYVDVILKLIAIAGDHVSEEVWYRVVQIITNNPDLQQYAARTVFKAVNSQTWHETAVKVAGYVLGEFGDYIANEPGSAPIDQFRALHSKFSASSLQTRALLLSSYVKMVNLFPEIREEVEKVFRQYSTVLDVEVQQRAAEYISILHAPSQQLLEIVCEEMPPFPEKSENALVSLVAKKEGETTDKRTVKARARDSKREGRAKTQLTNFGGSASAVRTTAISSRSSSSPSTPPPVPAKEDLLNLSQPTAPKANLLEDLLGLGTTSSSSQSIPTISDITPNTDRWFLRLLTQTDGILFEDDQLQIGLKSEYQVPRARLALYFGNKSPTSAYTSFSATVFPPTGVSVQVQQPAPQTIPPQAQHMQVILVVCDQEFSETPLLAVNFVSQQGPSRLVLRLPVIPSRFMSSVSLGAQDFFGRWKQIGGEERENIKDVRSSSVIVLDNIRAVLSAFNLAPLDGVDPNPSNLVGAGIFNPASGPKAGVLVRVQTSPADQAIRVTVRSTSPAVSKALTNLLATRLAV